MELKPMSKYTKNMPPAKKVFQGLLLTVKGEVKVAKLNGDSNGITKQTIQTALKGTKEPELLNMYQTKQRNIYLFGYSDGKAGTENKHELPPPLDSTLFFGSILLVASEKKHTFTSPVPFSPEEYEAFYNEAYGGFEDLDEDDEEEEEEEEEEEVEEVEAEETEVEADGAQEEDLAEEKEDSIAAEEDEEEVEGDDAEDEADAEDIEEEAVEVEGEGDFADEGPSRATRSRSKKKKSNEHHSSNLFTQQKPVSAQHYLEGLRKVHNSLKKEDSYTQIPYRVSMVETLRTFFGKKLSKQAIEKLEHVIYEHILDEAKKYNLVPDWKNGQFRNHYVRKMRHISLNLNPDTYIQNKGLFERFLSKEYKLEEIPHLNETELFPELNRELAEKMFQREQRLLEGNRAAATDQFICPRCHKRQCTYYEMQTRSADEPMTIFIQCVNCFKRWTQ